MTLTLKEVSIGFTLDPGGFGARHVEWGFRASVYQNKGLLGKAMSSPSSTPNLSAPGKRMRPEKGALS